MRAAWVLRVFVHFNRKAWDGEQNFRYIHEAKRTKFGNKGSTKEERVGEWSGKPSGFGASSPRNNYKFEIKQFSYGLKPSFELFQQVNTTFDCTTVTWNC